MICQDYLSDIMNDPVRSGCCRTQLLCRTLAGNNVYYVSVTTPSECAEDMKVSRIHFS